MINSANQVQTSSFEQTVLAKLPYNEAFVAPGQPRKHWTAILAGINDFVASGHLQKMQSRALRMRHEDGTTYNPFDAEERAGTSWNLDVVPLPLAAREWATLEAGLIQRARLLEHILTDVYGPQQLLKTELLPAELFYANPAFLRPCHGIQPLDGRFLACYAADLYRDTDGQFRVLREYSASPAGLGYALENRIVLSRIFPDLYRKSQVRRLAPFFQAIHLGMTQRVPTHRENPNIVLLTPGPESPIYFEHALLSRYLGYPLVECEDLTVRKGKLFLKKLAGLEPVDGVFRHVADVDSDPLALRCSSNSGVAGLVQASREQLVGISNPIGSGFIETPVLSLFLQSLCQQLLSEELQLKSTPGWWCGTEVGRQEARTRLGGGAIQAALESTNLTTENVEYLLAKQPYALMAREAVQPSVVPVWEGGEIRERPLLLRLYVGAIAGGFAVLPGGLAMTAANASDLLLGRVDQLESKDLWVLADGTVEHFSLMSSLHVSNDFLRSSDLPSRAADHLLWLGRYLERAEGRIRLLRSIQRRYTGEARPEEIPELGFLLSLLGVVKISLPQAEGSTVAVSQRSLHEQIYEAMFAKGQQESVASILQRAQEVAHRVRDRLSYDSWQSIARLDDFQPSAQEDHLELLEKALFTLNALSGLAMESMTRGLGWRFLDMGRRLERALCQVALIHAGLEKICTEPHNSLVALLEVSDSIMTYRARYRAAFQLGPVLDLILLDESNPKSLAFQLSQLTQHVDHLPRQDKRRFSSAEERISLELLTSVRLLNLTEIACSDEDASAIGSLRAFLEATEKHLLEFASMLNTHYLSRIEATPHFSTRYSGEGTL